MPGCTEAETSAAPEISAGAWFNTDELKLADLKGKLVVVEFWATWCPPCRASIPHLKELHDKYNEKGLVLISLSNEKKETVEPFVQKAGMTWAVAAESNSGGDYGVRGIPHAAVVKDGKIIWKGHPMSGLDKVIEENLSK